MGDNKAPNLVLSVIQNAVCFTEQQWKHENNTQPTQGKTGLEKWQEGKNLTVLIQFVSFILHGLSLFMLHSTQAAHTTNQKFVHQMGKNKHRETENTQTYGSPLVSTFRVHGVSQYSKHTLKTTTV